MRSVYFVCLFEILGCAMLAAQSNTTVLTNRLVSSNASGDLSKPEPEAQRKILESYGKLPLSFETNEGQTDAKVKFLSRGPGYTLFLTGDEAVFSLRQGRTGGEALPANPPLKPRVVPMADAVLRMKLWNANPAAKVTGLNEQGGMSNYFVGSDPAKWRTNVPTYAKVKYQEIYSGIDLVYYGNQQQLEYDLIVSPGADPHRIAFDVRGAKRIRQDAQGELVLKVGEAEIRWHKPIVYQETNRSRHEIAAHYVITDANHVGFKLAKYDTSRPLYIDPLIYSTYLGGSAADGGNGIAVDSSGNAYVSGYTESANFPITSGAFQTSLGGSYDAFVAKLNPTGSALVYSTYLGGSSYDQGNGIAVDSSGNAYLTGFTESANFPVTPGAFQTTFSGGQNAFVTKVNPAGSGLVYSTYLGRGGENGYGIAVDTAGDAYIAGTTFSPDFPVTQGAFQTTLSGAYNAFVTKFNPAGSALAYSTYLGGNYQDSGFGIAVDNSGNAYVTGFAESADFPVTPGAFETTYGGGNPEVFSCAFVTEFNSSGSALVYSTFLSGSRENEEDVGFGITVDNSGDAYVAGYTTSTNFPTTPGAFQTTLKGASNAFVTKLNPPGSGLVYSTYLGGNGYDLGIGLAIDRAGNAYVTGSTSSTNFPVTRGALQKNFAGVEDAFVTKFNPAGSALGYSTYLGGSGNDYGMGIAADSTGDVYVTGGTESADFPITTGAFQTTFGGVQDAFVTRIAIEETFASLIELVKQFDIKPDIAAIMVFTLELARVANRAHDAQLADALLDAFIDEVKEQSGKSLTATQATILIQEAKALMMRT